MENRTYIKSHGFALHYPHLVQGLGNCIENITIVTLFWNFIGTIFVENATSSVYTVFLRRKLHEMSPLLSNGRQGFGIEAEFQRFVDQTKKGVQLLRISLHQLRANRGQAVDGHQA